MKKQYKRPIAATLLTTALLGIGALPALATSILDDLNGDVALQAQLGGDQFTLHVLNTFTQNAVISGGPGNGMDANIGLTTGYLTDSLGNTQSDPFYMFCVDFKDDITLPVSYNVIIQGLETTPNPNGLSPEALQAMQTQALLGANFGDGSTPPDLATATAAQFDIWNLDDPTASITASALMTSLLNAAETAQGLPTADFSSDFLFDIDASNPNVNPANPNDPNSPGQAFMPLFTPPGNNNSGPPTPEPGTLAMLGLGLIGLGSLKLRKSRAK